MSAAESENKKHDGVETESSDMEIKRLNYRNKNKKLKSVVIRNSELEEESSNISTSDTSEQEERIKLKLREISKKLDNISSKKRKISNKKDKHVKSPAKKQKVDFHTSNKESSKSGKRKITKRNRLIGKSKDNSSAEEEDFQEDLDEAIHLNKRSRAQELAKSKTLKKNKKNTTDVGKSTNSNINNDDSISLHTEEDLTDHSAASDEDIYEDIELINEEDDKGRPLTSSNWAQTINGCWKAPKPFSNMKELYDKYKVPENCTNIRAPKQNPEIWELLKKKWQRKTDLQYAGIQKTLVKVSAAVIKMSSKMEELATDREVRLENFQTTIDSLTMLHQATHEISLKRKQYIKSVIKPEYHGLCSSKKVTEFLFGDELAKDIKEYDLKKKLTYKYQENYSGSKTYNYNTNNRWNTRRSRGGYFLGRGRGYRRPYNQNPYNQRGERGYRRRY